MRDSGFRRTTRCYGKVLSHLFQTRFASGRNAHIRSEGAIRLSARVRRALSRAQRDARAHAENRFPRSFLDPIHVRHRRLVSRQKVALASPPAVARHLCPRSTGKLDEHVVTAPAVRPSKARRSYSSRIKLFLNPRLRWFCHRRRLGLEGIRECVGDGVTDYLLIICA